MSEQFAVQMQQVDFDQKSLLTAAGQLWHLPERECRDVAIVLLALA